MATHHPTTGFGVPRFFEDYLLSVGAREIAESATCESCGGAGARWTLHQDGLNDDGPLCPPCLGSQHGADLAEERMVHALIGGAVTAALQASVSPALIRAAVDAAIDADTEAQAMYHGRLQGAASRR